MSAGPPGGLESTRRRALEVLREAYAAGSLDLEELETRVERALSGRSPRELDDTLADVVLTADERSALLDEEVAHWLARGWELRGDTTTTAALVLRRRPDHVFHAVLSLITGGVWLFVWAGVTLGAVEERLFLAVDDFGNVSGRLVR